MLICSWWSPCTPSEKSIWLPDCWRLFFACTACIPWLYRVCYFLLGRCLFFIIVIIFCVLVLSVICLDLFLWLNCFNVLLFLFLRFRFQETLVLLSVQDLDNTCWVWACSFMTCWCCCLMFSGWSTALWLWCISAKFQCPPLNSYHSFVSSNYWLY